jgi:hypothetical protein
MKLEGNDHFRAERWDEALFSYRRGLGQLPKRRDRRTERVDEDEGPSVREQDSGVDVSEGRQNGVKEVEVLSEAQVAVDKQYAKARSVINANIGACCVKLVCPALILL